MANEAPGALLDDCCNIPIPRIDPRIGDLSANALQQFVERLQSSMRRTIGIALILVGAIGVEICGIVLRHWPIPIPGFIFRRLGTLGFTVDPVKGPMSSVLLLTVGLFLLLQPKLARFK